MTATMSPTANAPLTPVTPDGRRLLPSSFNARAAPESTMTCPTGLAVRPIQRRFEDIFRPAGTNTVPISSPARRRLRTSGVRAFAITAAAPARITMSAAWSLVAIPPDPNLLAVSLTSDMVLSSTLVITSTTRPSLRTPSTTVSSTSRSAPSILATIAASTSFSP